MFKKEDVPNISEDSLTFQQDGTNPNWSREISHYLNEVFPGRKIGRSWPHFTPVNLFL